ncbi:MAG: hypothetical protein KR126chlam1_01148 [Chlamydiae bacterium]|nr:hypothetical protein [Chlamydiota bacterium]
MTVTRTITHQVTDRLQVTYNSDGKMVGDVSGVRDFLKDAIPSTRVNPAETQTWRAWAGEKASLAVKVAGVVALVAFAYEYGPPLFAGVEKSSYPLLTEGPKVVTGLVERANPLTYITSPITKVATGVVSAYETASWYATSAFAHGLALSWTWTAIHAKRTFLG